jgi:hypothetical protein
VTNEKLSDTRLGKNQRQAVIDELETQIHILWRTNEVRENRPQVRDEIKNGIYYFKESLFDAVPLVYRNLETRIRDHYPTANISVPSFRNYNVLFYGGWRQTGLSKRSAFTISLDQLKNRHNTKSGNTISGDLKLVLARYLHLYGDLDYQRSDFMGSRTDYYQDSNRFPITFHSRMRSKELHFVDHPLVGILIQINPVKKKEATSAQPTKESAKEISTKKQAGS